MIDCIMDNRVVTFDNKTYPKSGWAVVLVGAPGSGKTYIRENKLPIDGKIF